MSIEQLIKVAIAGIILYVMLTIMGELEALRWMLIVIGLTCVALFISTLTKDKQ